MASARQGTRVTLAEYWAMDTLEGLWELADGELYEMPPLSIEHQQLIGLLYHIMQAYLDAATPQLGIALLGVGVAMSEFLSPVPDLVFVRAGRENILRRNYIDGIPDLLVEVLSTDRRRDLVMKRGWYAEAGVPEYWIIDPVNETITVLELSGGEYVEGAVLGRNDTLTTATIPGFALSLEQLFGDPVREQIRNR